MRFLAASPCAAEVGCLSVALAFALALSGCVAGGGGGGAKAGSPSARAVTIEADPSGVARWVQTRAEARAGVVRITLNNPSSVAHDLHLVGAGVDAHTATIAQRRAPLSVRLRPGTYTYRCDVPGHVNMRGTLTVR
jgi:plastocyanin